jgi:hypothetical protein
MNDFPDLPDLPAGKTFYGKLLSLSAGQSSQKLTPLFHFDVRITDPGADVSPDVIKKIADSGFSLSDYNVGADFYLTPNAMKMLRRFLGTLGFSSNVTFREALHLTEKGEPTQETQEIVRGKDVMIKMPQMNENGRVYTNNVASGGFISGVKR